MKGLLSVLYVVFSAHYVNSQVTVVESGPSIVRPAQALDVTCTVTGASLTDSSKIYSVEWVRQFPGKGLEWMGRIIHNGDLYYAQSLKGRITISRDINQGKVYLKLSNVNTDDSGKYHCARPFDVWGQGTTVTVSSASPLAPTLFPLISCGTQQTQSTTIGCLARDFLPDSITFSWGNKDNASLSVFKQFNPVLQSGGKYLASSQIDVPTVSWEKSEPYYCSAKHPQGDKMVLLLKQNGGPKKPIVSIHPPMQEDVDNNENATLVCVVSGFYPSDIEINWQKNHNGPLKAITKGPVSDGNGGFLMTSYIVVTNTEWDTNNVFSCNVNHPASDFNEIKNISKSAVCACDTCGGDIKVTAKPPLFETIYMQNIAPLTCIISNMENKDGLEVSWYSGNEKLNTEIEDPTFNMATRKYNAKAIATVCPEDWRTKIFECRVSHPELPNVVVHTLSKPNGLDARPPTVLVFPPHQDELARKETATLTCMVKSFSPSDMFVKWLDNNNVEQSHVITTDPLEEISTSSKKTYFLYSTLTLTNVEDWNSGKAYTCLVGHESLPLYTTQRTIDKTSAQLIYIEEDDDIDNLWTTASTFIVLFLLSLFYSATVTLFKIK